MPPSSRPGAAQRRARGRAKVLRPRSVGGVRPYSLGEVHDLLADYYGPPEPRPKSKFQGH